MQFLVICLKILFVKCTFLLIICVFPLLLFDFTKLTGPFSESFNFFRKCKELIMENVTVSYEDLV